MLDGLIQVSRRHLKERLCFSKLFFSGGIPETFEVAFSNASNTVFTQTLTISQTLNASQLAGTTSGSPLYRLVLDLESTNPLTVCIARIFSKTRCFSFFLTGWCLYFGSHYS